ncbi:cytochrome c6 PetJ [Lyngbya sp. PCC 8106]|uniref:cytochrome c6 PetJ n=1 Tax=Lyngbya sp. (strain PCC 8106) TaxID=313612 RepID=UPI0000EAD1DC|nr:c-type cytochrome [Lyngbya sp. PCC 8106]EAW38236.1 cytochrome c6 [Lyngbya sp. PCC 8106]
MKKLFAFFLVAFAVLGLVIPSPALADGDPATGSQVFAANCNACHMGGKNVIMSNKTLSKADLAKYLKGFNDDPQAAIAYQITKGKNAMPAFKGRLSPQQIEDVSAYVFSKADKGW